MPRDIRDSLVDMVNAVEAQRRRDHVASPFMALRQAEGDLHSLLRRLDDDPQLAACQLRDRLPRILTLIEKANRWARAVEGCDPGDTPTHGAAMRRKGR